MTAKPKDKSTKDKNTPVMTTGRFIIDPVTGEARPASAAENDKARGNVLAAASPTGGLPKSKQDKGEQ